MTGTVWTHGAPAAAPVKFEAEYPPEVTALSSLLSSKAPSLITANFPGTAHRVVFCPTPKKVYFRVAAVSPCEGDGAASSLPR